MITIYNRRDLLITFDMQKQGEIRRILSHGGIDYTVKVVNRKSPSPVSAGTRAMTGTFGENLASEYEYIFYVNKNEYDRAAQAVRGMGSPM